MDLLLKGLAGAVVLIIIQLVARTQRPFIAGLLPLFPTITLITHYVVGTQRPDELKATIRFGFFSLIPYCAYLGALYVLVDRMPLVPALALATVAWIIVAALLLLIRAG